MESWILALGEAALAADLFRTCSQLFHRYFCICLASGTWRAGAIWAHGQCELGHFRISEVYTKLLEAFVSNVLHAGRVARNCTSSPKSRQRCTTHILISKNNMFCTTRDACAHPHWEQIKLLIKLAAGYLRTPAFWSW